MIAITTNNSTKVNPSRLRRELTRRESRLPKIGIESMNKDIAELPE
jgi:hypothetical protein